MPIQANYQAIEETLDETLIEGTFTSLLLNSKDQDPEQTLDWISAEIQQIGMGRYQYHLFMLCGLGWMADNLWLQALAVCMSNIQKEFSLSETWSAIGTT